MPAQQSTSTENIDWRNSLFTSAPAQLLLTDPVVKELNNKFLKMFRPDREENFLCSTALVQTLAGMQRSKGAKNVSVIRACYQILVVFSMLRGNTNWLQLGHYKAITSYADEIERGEGILDLQIGLVCSLFMGLSDSLGLAVDIGYPAMITPDMRAWFGRQLDQKRDKLVGEAFTLALNPIAPF
ncbi:MAG: hypothetical protein Q9216_005524 [Gyalolechia sp. 2 TL-2023]